jgi:Cu-processing system ATP-binding protein
MIRIKNLTKKYGKAIALQNVNINLKKGEAIALIGPNGSGKTTLIKSILGLVIPTEGDIFFNDESVLKEWQYRKEIGYMPQISRFPENMKVKQLLKMMKDVRKNEHRRLDEDLIRAFEIEKILNKTMRSLSGGTRQKVSACIAFLFSPQVLILDEPTAGLDPLSNEKLKQKIEKEKQKGKLILITSHVLSDLDDVVSQVVYLQESKLVFHKTIKELETSTGEQKLNRIIASIMKAPQLINETA